MLHPIAAKPPEGGGPPAVDHHRRDDDTPVPARYAEPDNWAEDDGSRPCSCAWRGVGLICGVDEGVARRAPGGPPNGRARR